MNSVFIDSSSCTHFNNEVFKGEALIVLNKNHSIAVRMFFGHFVKQFADGFAQEWAVRLSLLVAPVDQRAMNTASIKQKEYTDVKATVNDPLVLSNHQLSQFSKPA